MLDTVAEYRAAWYRLVGTTSADAALAENSETTNAVCDLHLTHGIREAQQFLVSHGMSWRWKKRSSAITSWSGTDAADGGRYTSLPTDFLRLDATDSRSALVEADGTPWGTYVTLEYGQRQRGNLYYLKNGQLWLSKGAAPPASVYIDYVFAHPEFTGAVTLDFPVDAAGLAIAYAAEDALGSAWFPHAQNEARIIRNVEKWQRQASRVARRDRNPRRFRGPRVVGNWMLDR
jgi:hypothetical protein